jgi:hydrogenase maturation protease
VPSVLVACVGNIFLGDDGFGVEVARRLAERKLPDGVRVVDFGIRSYDLAYALMEDWDLTVLVDAVPRGGEPGTIYVIEPELPSGSVTPALDAHAMNPVAVLQMVAALGGAVKRMLVVGCEPARGQANEEAAMDLSEPVRAAVDEAVRVVEELVANSGAIQVPETTGRT